MKSAAENTLWLSGLGVLRGEELLDSETVEVKLSPMQCRQCGTEIADKAIVCFRCGAGTSDPVRKPVAVKPPRSPFLSAGMLIVFLMVALYMWQVSRTAANPELPQLAAGLAIGAALVVLLVGILRKR
jgi:hypothetical protein